MPLPTSGYTPQGATYYFNVDGVDIAMEISTQLPQAGEAADAAATAFYAALETAFPNAQIVMLRRYSGITQTEDITPS